MKNRELIALFKNAKGLESDVEVAHVLDQSQSIVPGWNTERRPIPINIKFRLLDHIQFAENIKAIATCFVDLNEHEALMQEDLDRIEDLHKRKSGQGSNFINMAEVHRLTDLQKSLELSDTQLSKQLQMTSEKLAQIKAGKLELTRDDRIEIGLLKYLGKGTEVVSDLVLPKNVASKVKKGLRNYRKTGLDKGEKK